MGAEYWVQQRVASCPYEQPSPLNDVIGDSKNNPQQDSQQQSKEHSQESRNAEKVHGLEFHFDKDEDAAEQDDEWIHPKYSTATYLDAQIECYPAGGAPLIVFQTSSEEEEEGDGEGDEGEEEEEEEEMSDDDSDTNEEEVEDEEEEDDDDVPESVNLQDSIQRDKENKTRSEHQEEKREEQEQEQEREGLDEEELNPTTPLSAWIIFPVINRHVSFPGTFLHGVAGELLQPSLLLKSHQNSDGNSNGNNNSNESNNKYDNNNSSNNYGNTSSENTKKRQISEEKSRKFDGNSDKINLRGKCYNYSRLSLLVNVWTTHHPKAVKRLDIASFNSQFEKDQQIELKMLMRNENKSVKNPELKFNFNDFIENLDSDENKKYLSFTPCNPNGKSKIKINENVGMEFKDSRSSSCNLNLKLKLKYSCMSKVNVQEGINDGVISMMGNGIEEKNVRVCYVDIPPQWEKKEGKEEREDGEEVENKDYDINDSDNNTNNDNSNRRSSKSNEIENNKAKNKNNEEDVADKVIAISKYNKNRRNGNSENNSNNLSNESDIYFLREHRPGDTAPVPLKPLREEFQNSSKIGVNYGKIIHVKYNYADVSALLLQ